MKFGVAARICSCPEPYTWRHAELVRSRYSKTGANRFIRERGFAVKSMS